MIILGIESSCDETAAAVIESTDDGGIRLLSNITATSAGVHARTGGIIPEEAARKQVESIIPVIDLALKDAFSDQQLAIRVLISSYIDAIAVTIGPGLIGSLLVGVETAKTLAFVTGKPIIPVNHLVGHIYANWIVDDSPPFSAHSQKQGPLTVNSVRPSFPALALVVSGGHTDLVLMKDHGQLEWIGGTRDDAAGEAFDKTARLLGFEYPGGPLLSKAADEYLSQLSTVQSTLNLLPRPLLNQPNFDFSFSGLKTAVLRTIKDLVGEDQNMKMADYQWLSKMDIVQSEKSRLAAEIQEAIVDVLVDKALRAVEHYKPRSLLLAGGVSANSRLKEKMVEKIKKQSLDVQFHVPAPLLCTDNAGYIAGCSFYNYRVCDWKNIDANPELTIMDKI